MTATVTDLVTARHNRGMVPLHFTTAREALQFAWEELAELRTEVPQGQAPRLDRAIAIVAECYRMHVGYRASHEEESR